ncbi:hypothetical protein D3C80_1677450 [compost metagenome]
MLGDVDRAFLSLLPLVVELDAVRSLARLLRLFFLLLLLHFEKFLCDREVHCRIGPVLPLFERLRIGSDSLVVLPEMQKGVSLIVPAFGRIDGGEGVHRLLELSGTIQGGTLPHGVGKRVRRRRVVASLECDPPLLVGSQPHVDQSVRMCISRQ